jgi:hypothetical protein
MSESHKNWPSFWSEVPEEDRATLREVLADLLGRGVILGDTASGRDQFLLVRDHYQKHLEDYLSVLGMSLIIDDDFCLLQAQPRSEDCALLAQFSKDETLLLLVLWRAWDDERSNHARQTVILPVDEVWQKFRNIFDKIDPPEKTHLEAMLGKFKRHRLVRTSKPDGATQLGEMMIEILPSLPRVIPFDSLEAYLDRLALYQAPTSSQDS